MKSNIAAIIFVVVLHIFVLILIYLRGSELSKIITSEDIRLLNLVKLLILGCFFLGLTGHLIGALIIEISGLRRNKHMLTLSMWERIQELENDVKELKAGTQVDGQQISDVDGGGSASGAE